MITITPIFSFNDALQVRKIRNSCRQYMTHNTKEIGFLGQIRWWIDYESQNKKEGYKWCYLVRNNKIPVGYGLVRYIDGKHWLSGGLLPEVRGQGLGKKLFEFLIKEYSPHDLYLEVLKSNEKAYKLYSQLGFKKTGEENDIVTMAREGK